MAKLIAYTALHYGKEWLAYAIRSVIDDLDTLYVLYTAQPSYGHATSEPCPESREELYAIARQAAGNKLRWIDVAAYGEGQHRDLIFTVAPNADFILALDADEVWAEGLVKAAIEHAKAHPTVRRWHVPTMTYWRSFTRAMPNDMDYPVRLTNTHAREREGFFSNGSVINHFGYFQSLGIVRYKWLIHGHLPEYRKDCDWFTDKYLANAQADVYPAGIGKWYPQDVDPLDYCPSWIVEHPEFAKVEM